MVKSPHYWVSHIPQMFISNVHQSRVTRPPPTLRCRGRAPSLAAGRGLGASMNCFFFETSRSILKKIGFWMILDDPSPKFSESFRYIVAFPLILSFV